MEINNHNKDIYFENECIVEEGDSSSEDSGTDEPAVGPTELPLNLVKLEEPQLTPIPPHEVITNACRHVSHLGTKATSFKHNCSRYCLTTTIEPDPSNYRGTHTMAGSL